MKAKEFLRTKKRNYLEHLYTEEEVIKFIIEYAKLTCKEQRFSCLKNVQIKVIDEEFNETWKPFENDRYIIQGFWVDIKVENQSILDAPEPKMI